MMNNIQIGQPACYEMVYQDNASENLVITFTPTNGYFLYHNDLQANKLCISTTKPNYYIYNAGSACNKITDFLQDKNIKNIICIGSSKAGLASILWAELLKRKLPGTIQIFALSFSPQTLLYPFNEGLYFPSYQVLWKSIMRDKGMEKCAINYGDLNVVLQDSDLKGLVVYPKQNPCDRSEAERLTAKNIKLKAIDFPLHGSFLPFMPQAKDDEKLLAMVEKLYNNAQKDEDTKATIPTSKEELYQLVKSIQVPTIDELVRAIFFNMKAKQEWSNYQMVKNLGFV